MDRKYWDVHPLGEFIEAMGRDIHTLTSVTRTRSWWQIDGVLVAEPEVEQPTP